MFQITPGDLERAAAVEGAALVFQSGGLAGSSRRPNAQDLTALAQSARSSCRFSRSSQRTIRIAHWQELHRNRVLQETCRDLVCQPEQRTSKELASSWAAAVFTRAARPMVNEQLECLVLQWRLQAPGADGSKFLSTKRYRDLLVGTYRVTSEYKQCISQHLEGRGWFCFPVSRNATADGDYCWHATAGDFGHASVWEFEITPQPVPATPCFSESSSPLAVHRVLKPTAIYSLP